MRTDFQKLAKKDLIVMIENFSTGTKSLTTKLDVLGMELGTLSI